MRTPGVAVLVACVLTAPALAAQEASPYVPLSHWSVPYIEHLIATGVMPDPTPLTRPFRRADLVRALHDVDTLAAGAAVTATVRRLLADFASRESGPRYRSEGDVGIAAATYSKRDPLAAIDSSGPRQAGPEHGFVDGGLALELAVGQVVAATHPYFDTRLKYDPDWFGKKDRKVAGRNAEGYISAQWKLGRSFSAGRTATGDRATSRDCCWSTERTGSINARSASGPRPASRQRTSPRSTTRR